MDAPEEPQASSLHLSWQEFLAGWIAGITGLVCSHPMDTIKVRQQEVNISMFGVIKQTFRNEGIRGYFRGISFPMIMVGTQNSIYFGSFSNTLRFIKENFSVAKSEAVSESSVLLAGGVAGFIQVMTTAPVELIKVRMQVENAFGGKTKTSLIGTMIYVYKKKGPLGFYKGFIPTIMRDVPSGMLYFSVYNNADRRLQQHINNYWSHLLSGGLAGMLSYAPTIPCDVIKTRLQADNLDNPNFDSLTDCMTKIYRNDGIATFFRGFLPFNARAFISNAIIFVIYEICIETLL